MALLLATLETDVDWSGSIYNLSFYRDPLRGVTGKCNDSVLSEECPVSLMPLQLSFVQHKLHVYNFIWDNFLWWLACEGLQVPIHFVDQ